MRFFQLVWILSLCSIIFFGCSKNSDDPIPNNNEVNATVAHTNGSLVIITARTDKAILGLRSPLGGPGYMYGSNAANAAVSVNLYPSITSTGTFDFATGFRCGYRVNAGSTSTPIYDNTNFNGGSITITVFRDGYIEGSFNAICRNGNDSVIVTGTFKGNKIAK
jgi:hypothetical protein